MTKTARDTWNNLSKQDKIAQYLNEMMLDEFTLDDLISSSSAITSIVEIDDPAKARKYLYDVLYKLYSMGYLVKNGDVWDLTEEFFDKYDVYDYAFFDSIYAG